VTDGTDVLIFALTRSCCCYWCWILLYFIFLKKNNTQFYCFSKFSLTSVIVLCIAQYCTYCCFFHSDDVMYMYQLLYEFISNACWRKYFRKMPVIDNSNFKVFLILNYAILFVRVAVVVNFIKKFCSWFPTAYLSGSAKTAMAFSCSFQRRTGTSCSYDRLDKNKSLEIISLRNCSKDITGHCSHLSFSGKTTESELILARVGVFSEEETSSSQKLDTICTYHRRELGVGWRRNFTKCNVPQIISKQGRGVLQNAERRMQNAEWWSAV